jgi:hypothetical protein
MKASVIHHFVLLVLFVLLVSLTIALRRVSLLLLLLLGCSITAIVRRRRLAVSILRGATYLRRAICLLLLWRRRGLMITTVLIGIVSHMDAKMRKS